MLSGSSGPWLAQAPSRHRHERGVELRPELEQRAIDQLPAAQRTVVGLAAIEGLPHAEIAAVLGIPVGTVGSRLHEARDRLRALLAKGRVG